MQAPHYPPLPVVPAPWMAHRCPTTGAVYYVNLQTLATTWTSPVPAPPPEDVPCATCMECPCVCAARADDARAKALEAVKAHTTVPQKYTVAEEVPVDQSRRGPVCMNQNVAAPSRLARWRGDAGSSLAPDSLLDSCTGEGTSKVCASPSTVATVVGETTAATSMPLRRRRAWSRRRRRSST